MNKFGRNIALWIVIGVLLVALFNLFQNNTSRSSYSSLAFSDFLGEVEQGRVSDVTIQGNTINGHFNDGRAFSTYAPNDPGIVDRLRGGGVRISAAPKEEGMSGLLGILISWFPMLLFIGVWIFSGYLVTRRISRNDSHMGNLGPVIFFGFIIFFASFELLEWISNEICQTKGN